MNIIITGCAGHLGSLLTKKFLKEGHQVFGIDNLATGSYSNIPSDKNFHFFLGDINANCLNTLLPVNITYHAIYHYAACVGVQRTINNPALVFEDLMGLRYLIDFVLRNKINRVFYSSSSEVYGEPVALPLNENSTPLNTRLPYAAVKSMGELFIKEFSLKHGFDYTIFRFFNTYSEHQSLDFVIPIFINKALKNEDIEIFGDGSQTRTFLYADDNVNFTFECLFNKSTINQVINVGSDAEVSIKSLAELIISEVNSTSKIRFLDSLKKGDMTRRKPDNRVFLKNYNRDLISLKEGIRKFLDI